MSLAQASGVALTATAALYVGALARLRGVERGGAPGRWFGYARDGTNLAAAAGFSLGFLLAGFPGPSALVLGCGLTLATYLGDWALGRRFALRGATVVALVATLAVAGGILAAQREVGAALDVLLAALAPRGQKS